MQSSPQLTLANGCPDFVLLSCMMPCTVSKPRVGYQPRFAPVSFSTPSSKLKQIHDLGLKRRFGIHSRHEAICEPQNGTERLCA